MQEAELLQDPTGRGVAGVGLGLPLPLASDSVYGIKYARPVETRADLAR